MRCSTPTTSSPGLSSLNADGGITVTKVDGSDIVDVAKMVDRAGFILPIVWWKGDGGTMDVRTLCFETFTFAACTWRDY